MHASCLCGAISWDVEGPLEWLSHCHCSRCRKAHGVGFASYGAAPADRFRLAGRDRIGRFESSPGFDRCFCTRCGSVVPGDPVEGRVFVPVGNCDDDPGARPLAHIFVASKAPWYEIADSLPRFDAFPPGVEAAVLPDRPPEDPPGATRGSCLCGAVAFRVEGKPETARNCHCSRCRKARSAAHCANLFVAADGVRFTRGADQLASYKVPDAMFFTHVFCRTCGGCLPRVDRERGVAVVPMGALDDDPGLRPQYHIFVGSKAPWFEITDALPQHEERPPT
jgi:hypothetical protein